MGTRNNPGARDPLAKLHPDEPFFVIRGQDVLCVAVVAMWIQWATLAGVNPEKIAEAHECLRKMMAWPDKKRPD